MPYLNMYSISALTMMKLAWFHKNKLLLLYAARAVYAVHRRYCTVSKTALTLTQGMIKQNRAGKGKFGVKVKRGKTKLGG
jgi:hypothetical protein